MAGSKAIVQTVDDVVDAARRRPPMTSAVGLTNVGRRVGQVARQDIDDSTRGIMSMNSVDKYTMWDWFDSGDGFGIPAEALEAGYRRTSEFTPKELAKLEQYKEEFLTGQFRALPRVILSRNSKDGRITVSATKDAGLVARAYLEVKRAHPDKFPGTHIPVRATIKDDLKAMMDSDQRGFMPPQYTMSVGGADQRQAFYGDTTSLFSTKYDIGTYIDPKKADQRRAVVNMQLWAHGGDSSMFRQPKEPAEIRMQIASMYDADNARWLSLMRGDHRTLLDFTYALRRNIAEYFPNDPKLWMLTPDPDNVEPTTVARSLSQPIHYFLNSYNKNPDDIVKLMENPGPLVSREAWRTHVAEQTNRVRKRAAAARKEIRRIDSELRAGNITPDEHHALYNKAINSAEKQGDDFDPSWEWIWRQQRKFIDGPVRAIVNSNPELRKFYMDSPYRADLIGGDPNMPLIFYHGRMDTFTNEAGGQALPGLGRSPRDLGMHAGDLGQAQSFSRTAPTAGGARLARSPWAEPSDQLMELFTSEGLDAFRKEVYGELRDVAFLFDDAKGTYRYTPDDLTDMVLEDMGEGMTAMLRDQNMSSRELRKELRNWFQHVRTQGSTGENVTPFVFRGKRPFLIGDPQGWHAVDILKKLNKTKDISDDLREEIETTIDLMQEGGAEWSNMGHQAQEMWRLMNKAGYDHLLYYNQYEGVGRPSIIFNDESLMAPVFSGEYSRGTPKWANALGGAALLSGLGMVNEEEGSEL